MPELPEKPKKVVTVTTRSRSSQESVSTVGSSTIAPSLRSPRTARFAEATAVDSPIDAPRGRSLFVDPPSNHFMAQAQPADVGFGYINNESVEMPNTDKNEYPATTPKTPLKSPLKSAMKTPGAPPRDLGRAVLSPPIKDPEEYLEKREKMTEKQQARDVKIKTRVRVAKFLLRSVNFSCSLIVLAMLSTTLNIVRATESIPPRSSFTAWAPQQKIWPQVVVLSISAVSLFFSILILYGYWKGGHRRAAKAATYYTAFAVAFFVFSIVMWAIGAAILQGSRNSSNGKDIWSWSCTNNTRKVLFQNDVGYDLICRLNSWSLICAIIEVVVESITIGVYSIMFYRFYSKKELHKSMEQRDRVRSDVYLRELRSQSAPNTPAAPYSAKPPVDYYTHATEIEEGHTQFVNADQKPAPAPFRLQPAPIKTGATPKMEQVGFTPIQTSTRERTPSPPEDQFSPLMADVSLQTTQEHFHAAPGEQVYEYVPPPGAYEAAPQSPGAESFHTQHMQFPR